MTLIDIHAHVITTDDRYPRAPIGGTSSQWSQRRQVTWEQLRAEMDVVGMAGAAVVQASTVYGYDNSYVVDCVAMSEGRVTGVAAVDFHSPDAPQAINRWTAAGASGLRLFVAGSTMPEDDLPRIDAPSTMPAWERAAELGMSVSIQLSVAALPQVVAVARLFPDVPLILDHAGRVDLSSGPPYTDAEAVYRLADCGSVHLKVTTRNFRDAASSRGGASGMLSDLVSHFGAERVAWGSNFPASEGSLSALVDMLDEACAELTREDALDVLGRTALSLYPILGR